MTDDDYGFEPTPEQPLLAGMLVDVSASMKDSIQSRTGKTLSRLESLRLALDDLVTEARKLAQLDSVKIFAYGFGFGNPISLLFRRGPQVRDLLQISELPASTISVAKLANDWTLYRRHIEDLVVEMGGVTPMGQGFQLVAERFERELQDNKFTAQPVLFVLSDGEPTDVSPDQIIKIAGKMKQRGVIIVSCYVTDAEIAEWRHIYGSSLPQWPDGAKLMFECASVVLPNTPFYAYLREHKFKIEEGGRIFSQINQSETLSTYIKIILSPVHKTEDAGEKYAEEIKNTAPGPAVSKPIIKNISALLTEGFNVEELRRFCFEEPEFKVVYNRLAPETGKEKIVQILLEYSQQQVLIETLLEAIKKRNPKRYERHQPYWE